MQLLSLHLSHPRLLSPSLDSNDAGYRESFAVMYTASSRPTTTGFSARLVDDAAGWSRGKIYWMAIGK